MNEGNDVLVASYLLENLPSRDRSWAKFLMRRTAGSILSREAIIAISDMIGGGFHAKGENQPFHFIPLGRQAFLFDDCLLIDIPELPETLITTLPGQDAGKVFDFPTLKGTVITGTERIRNGKLRCLLRSKPVSLDTETPLREIGMWIRLACRLPRRRRGQKRVDKRLDALTRFMR